MYHWKKLYYGLELWSVVTLVTIALYIPMQLLEQMDLDFAPVLKEVCLPQIGNVIIGNNVEIAPTLVWIGKFSSTVLGDGCKIDNLVQIGHNSKLGRLHYGRTQWISWSVTLGDGVIIGGSAYKRSCNTR
jgi:hypothetical protein